jgi:hypothetical protein
VTTYTYVCKRLLEHPATLRSERPPGSGNMCSYDPFFAAGPSSTMSALRENRDRKGQSLADLCHNIGSANPWLIPGLAHQLHIPRMRALTSMRGPLLAVRAAAPGHRERPSGLFKLHEQRIGNEAGSQRIDVAVAPGVVSMGKEALGHEKIQIIRGRGDGHIMQPPFLLDLSCGPSAEIRGHAAIDHIEHVHRFHSCPLAEWIVDRIK